MKRNARALLAEQARKMKETIAEVMRTERDPITAHKLAEVAAECEWCERNYGIHDWDESQQHRRATEMADNFNAERQNEKETNKKGNNQTWKQ